MKIKNWIATVMIAASVCMIYKEWPRQERTVRRRVKSVKELALERALHIWEKEPGGGRKVQELNAEIKKLQNSESDF